MKSKKREGDVGGGEQDQLPGEFALDSLAVRSLSPSSHHFLSRFQLKVSTLLPPPPTWEVVFGYCILLLVPIEILFHTLCPFRFQDFRFKDPHPCINLLLLWFLRVLFSPFSFFLLRLEPINRFVLFPFGSLMLKHKSCFTMCLN